MYIATRCARLEAREAGFLVYNIGTIQNQGLLSFQKRDTKSDIFLAENQHSTHKKILYFGHKYFYIICVTVLGNLTTHIAISQISVLVTSSLKPQNPSDQYLNDLYPRINKFSVCYQFLLLKPFEFHCKQICKQNENQFVNYYNCEFLKL